MEEDPEPYEAPPSEEMCIVCDGIGVCQCDYCHVEGAVPEDCRWGGICSSCNGLGAIATEEIEEPE